MGIRTEFPRRVRKIDPVTSAMTSDVEAFHVTTLLEVYEGAARIFARTWAYRFPRDHV